MPESVLSAVQISVIGALAAWMITGFTPLPGRWLRWRMFCRALVKDRLPHRRLQYAVPGLVRRHAGNLGERDVRLWRLVAAATVLAESPCHPRYRSRRRCRTPSRPGSPCTPRSPASSPASS
ncbi:hypothetical protein [Streptomyces sp. NTK 937]|uniref:hypothetical protein n=1 Tax=Streptomyces sp. NTK 937 TaxID=1487711 RepID=UPI001F5235D5|nr:hypothetical protein [Streptomyces sp. NTK 937]